MVVITQSDIQDEIINIFGELIQSDLVKSIFKSGFYSVIADETTDIVQIEYYSLFIRYIDVNLCQIKEDFPTFVPIHDVTLLELANVLQIAL